MSSEMFLRRSMGRGHTFENAPERGRLRAGRAQILHRAQPRRRSILRGNKANPLTLDKGLLVDFSLIAIDGLAGLAIALSLFAQPSALLAILLGALGGMLPDPFQFVHRLYPHEPLRTVQRFHSWIHAKQKLDWPLGIASQLAFNVAVILLAVELQM